MGGRGLQCKHPLRCTALHREFEQSLQEVVLDQAIPAFCYHAMRRSPHEVAPRSKSTNSITIRQIIKYLTYRWATTLYLRLSNIGEDILIKPWVNTNELFIAKFPIWIGGTNPFQLPLLAAGIIQVQMTTNTPASHGPFDSPEAGNCSHWGHRWELHKQIPLWVWQKTQPHIAAWHHQRTICTAGWSRKPWRKVGNRKPNSILTL